MKLVDLAEGITKRTKHHRETQIRYALYLPEENHFYPWTPSLQGAQLFDNIEDVRTLATWRRYKEEGWKIVKVNITYQMQGAITEGITKRTQRAQGNVEAWTIFSPNRKRFFVHYDKTTTRIQNARQWRTQNAAQSMLDSIQNENTANYWDENVSSSREFLDLLYKVRGGDRAAEKHLIRQWSHGQENFDVKRYVRDEIKNQEKFLASHKALPPDWEIKKIRISYTMA